MQVAAFEAWAAAQGHDVKAMAAVSVDGKQRVEQLRKFHEEISNAPDPHVGKDAAAAAVKIGDSVTLTLKVTGVRLVPGDIDRGIPDRYELELARVVGNSDRHLMSCDATWVKKA